MPLTDTAVRNARPGPKPRKVADGGGLYLLVAPSGGKLWRLKYRFGGKEKLLALGVYPDVRLADARARRDDARRRLASGVDPASERKQARAASRDTFHAVASEWLAKSAPAWSPAHGMTVKTRLEKYLLPHLGDRPVADITPPEVLAVLRRVEGRGTHETAKRLRQIAGSVFAYAVSTGRAQRDPTQDLRGALTAPAPRNFAAVTEPRAVGAMLRALDDYQGHHVTRCALRLAPLVFVRPGELRQAEWAEVDFDAAEWRIPAHRMKMRSTHIVPLSTQALAVLRDLHALTGTGRYLFPSVRTSSRPMSNNAVLSALRRMGFTKEEMTGHGFRSTASTLLNEQGWNRDAIERQLAHSERDGVRAAYNHADFLPERRKMMQAWADYLDGLKRGGEVIPFVRPAS